jgi:hypothetical protein
MSPLFGLQESHYLKLFRYIRFFVKGYADFRIRVFKDGSETSSQTIFSMAITDRDVFKQKMEALCGHSARGLRVEISVPRGTGEFEFIELSAGYRRKSAFRKD